MKQMSDRSICSSDVLFEVFSGRSRVYCWGGSYSRGISSAFIEITENPLEATHVLVGSDRYFTYDKLNLAVMAVRNGAKIIVTNPDPSCPVPGGVISDTLSIARAIEVASGHSISDVIGKPSPFFGERMLGQLNIDRERCLIIGDRLETDILLGKINRFPTCLVLTGVASKEDVEEKKIYPDFIVGNLTALWNE